MKPFNRIVTQSLPVWFYFTMLLLIWMASLDWTGVDIVDWIGALSGWAAAGAALWTLRSINKSVNAAQVANKQAQDSHELLQEQTRAITGELKPIFNHSGFLKQAGLYPERYKTVEILRFWNYNRRDVTLVGIQLEGKHENVQLSEVTFRKESENKIFAPFGTKGKFFQHQAYGARQETKVNGTPVGQRCSPIEFRVTFQTIDRTPFPRNYEIILNAMWRFRDGARSTNVLATCSFLANTQGLLEIEPDSN